MATGALKDLDMYMSILAEGGAGARSQPAAAPDVVSTLFFSFFQFRGLQLARM